VTKWEKLILWLMGIITLAAFAAGTLFFLTLHKAFTFVFEVDITLINRSGEPVKVWCLGIWGNGDIDFPPFVKVKKFAWLEWEEYLDLTTITLASGEKRNLSYDCDDFEVRWIVVRSIKGGAYKLIRVDPSKSSFVIPPLKTLPNAPQNLVDFIEAASREKKPER